jgi:predicted ester cyclase
MTVEQNKALKHRICDEIWNEGNLDLIPELVAPSWSSGRFKGPDGFREMVSSLRTAFPDLRITIDNLVGEGDMVSYHSTLQGTFKGKFGDNEPTARTVNFKTAYCDRFADGKWVEMVWGVSPTAELFQQMGISSPTSKDHNVAVVRSFLEGVDKGNDSIIAELTSPGFVHHAVGRGLDMDREALRRSMSSPSFPDEVITIEDIVADGDKVAIRTTNSGTHKGQVGNVAPTGNKVKFSEFVIFHLKNGRITEDWSLIDRLGMFQQIGALPPTSEIGKK